MCWGAVVLQQGARLLLAQGRPLQSSIANTMRVQACSADLVGRVSGASNGVVNVDCRGTQIRSSLEPEKVNIANLCLGKSKAW